MFCGRSELLCLDVDVYLQATMYRMLRTPCSTLRKPARVTQLDTYLVNNRSRVAGLVSVHPCNPASASRQRPEELQDARLLEMMDGGARDRPPFCLQISGELLKGWRSLLFSW